MKRSVPTTSGGKSSKAVIDLTNDSSSDPEPDLKRQKNDIKTAPPSSMSRKQVKRQRWLDNKKSRQRDETRIGRRELQLPEEVVGSRPQLQEAWGPRPSAACNGDPDLAVLPGPDVFSHPSGQFRARLCPDPTDFFPVAQRLCCPGNLLLKTSASRHIY